MSEAIKDFIQDGVGEFGTVGTTLMLSLMAFLAFGFAALVAWIWWPLVIIFGSIIGGAGALVAWSGKGKA